MSIGSDLALRSVPTPWIERVNVEARRMKGRNQ